MIRSKTLTVAVVAALAGSAGAQWSTMGSLISYNAGPVGIGTSNPAGQLDIRSSGTRTVSAFNNAQTGYNYAVHGTSLSNNGRGVYGIAQNIAGNGAGVFGVSNGFIGRGVYGYATDARGGASYGVEGKANSGGGAGVFGHNAAGVGVLGNSSSTDSAGSPTSAVAGVRGVVTSESPGGWSGGVWGINNSTTGNGVGVGGFTAGTGFGVYGQAAGANGWAGYFVGDRNYFSGRVGIGTTSPTFSLDVRGAMRLGDGTTREQDIAFISQNGDWQVGTNDSGNGTDSNHFYVYDTTSSAYRLTVQKGTGNVGIGTPSPTAPLHVYGPSTATSNATIYGRSEKVGGYGVYGHASAADAYGVLGFAQATSGTNYGVYGYSGSAAGYDFYAAGPGTNYGAASSRRWKNSIVNIDNPLEKLGRLRGVYYNWNEDHGGRHDVGFIAEEVGEVLPEIVNYEDNGIDASGMDYSKMTPLLVEAVNALRAEKNEQLAALRSEHDAQIARRDADLDQLRTDNDELRDRLARLEAVLAEFTSR